MRLSTILPTVAAGAMLTLAGVSPAAAQAACSNDDATLIKDDKGTPIVCGDTVSNTSIYVYRGIPYALPPVPKDDLGKDTLRWKEPQPAAWPTKPAVKRATFGNICPQSMDPPADQTMGEDCLYLNVWTPKGAVNNGSKLPVMVFIHGGAFVTGAGSLPAYDGTAMAAQNMVVVTLNYRLGVFGFLSSDMAAGKNSGAPPKGNLGIMDQQLALKWVKSNISQFGGDSGNITVFGESAGAMSVGLHNFAIPSSADLFNAAIMESNPAGLDYKAPSAKYDQAKDFAGRVCTEMFGSGSCPNTMDWLRSTQVSADTILKAQSKTKAPEETEAPTALGTGTVTIFDLAKVALPWSPVMDGDFIKAQPTDGYVVTKTPIIGKKTYKTAVPLGFGVNANEATPFVAFAFNEYPTKFTKNNYRDALLAIYSADAVKVNNIMKTPRYNPATYENNNSAFNNGNPENAGTGQALSNFVTDWLFVCPNIKMADAALTTGKDSSDKVPPVYGYYFSQPPFFNLYTDLGVTQCNPEFNQVCHANELSYVFNTLKTVKTKNTPTQGDVDLANAMNTAWGNFAKGSRTTNWVQYASGGPVKAWASAPPSPTWNLATNANCAMIK